MKTRWEKDMEMVYDAFLTVSTSSEDLVDLDNTTTQVEEVLLIYSKII